MAHTPGPWRYEKSKCAILAGEDKVEDGLVVEPATSIVDLYGAMGGEDTDADARLMAAAPELLDALRMALRAPVCPFCGADNTRVKEGRWRGGRCINKECAGVKFLKKIEG